MAWTESRVFRQTVADVWGNTTAMNIKAAGDSVKAALFNNTPTPDMNVAAAATAYNTGQWVIGNEVSQAGQWAAGGVVLANQQINVGTAGVVFFDADDPASGTAATLANVFGVLHYDDTLTTPVADQGICYNYLGGVQSVTGGQFTVVNHVNGIWRQTL